MPGENYNDVLAKIRNAERELAELSKPLDAAKSDFLAAKKDLDTLLGTRAYLDILLAEYTESLQLAETERVLADEKRKADIERLGAKIEVPAFDMKDQMQFAEEKKPLTKLSEIGKKADTEYISELMSLLDKNYEKADEAGKDHAMALIEYVKTAHRDNSAFLEQEEIFLELNNHKGSKHDIRGQIKSLISEYNKKNKDNKLKTTFTDLIALDKTDSAEYGRQMDIIKGLAENTTKFSGANKEALVEYTKRFDTYIKTRNLGQNGLKLTAEIDKIIDAENINRQYYNDMLNGKIPSLADITKMKEDNMEVYSFFGKVADGLITGYNFKAERAERLARNKTSFGMGNTPKAEYEVMPFKNMDEYYRMAEDIKQRRSIIKMDDHKGKEHALRGEIRNLIGQIDKAKKVPDKFTKLAELCEKNPEEYKIAAANIFDVITQKGGDRTDELKNYFSNFDILTRTEKRFDRASEKLAELIENEADAKKRVRDDVSRQNENLKAVSSVEKYQQMLAERSAEYKKEFDDRLKEAEDSMKSADFKKKLLSAGGKVLNDVTNMVSDITVALCLASIKGELAEQEEKINTLKEEIELRSQAIEAANQISASESGAIARDINAGNISAISSNGFVALNSDKANRTILEGADRNILVDAAKRELKEKRAELVNAQKEYTRLLNEKKEAIKNELAEFLGENEVNGIEDVETLKDKAGTGLDVQYAADVRRAIENEVNAKVGGTIAKAEKQAEANRQQREIAVGEAQEKQKISELEQRTEKSDQRSSKISKLFTESNLCKIDTVVSVLQTGINMCISSADNEQSTGIDISQTLEELKQKFDDMNNPDFTKQHVALQIIDVCKGLRETLERINRDFQKKLVETEMEASLKTLNFKTLEKEKQAYDRLKETTADKKLEPVFLYNEVQYILNADVAALANCDNNVQRIKGYIDEANGRKAKMADEVSAARTQLDEKAANLKDSITRTQNNIGEKTKELEKLADDLHKARNAAVREFEAQNGDRDMPYVKVRGEDMGRAGFGGLDMLKKLTGTDFAADIPQADLRRAFDKIYINGISASQMFMLDKALEGIGDNPDAIRDKYREIGETFRQCFEETLSLKDSGTKESNMLTGQIIAVEDEHFMLRPVVLTNGNIENEYHDDFSNSQSFKTAAYRDALNFNANCIEMCRGLNEVRREAAKAEYDKKAVGLMNSGEKKENVRRINLDTAVRLSTGGAKKPEVKTKAVDKALEGLELNPPSKQH